jgi:hypothetical protein
VVVGAGVDWGGALFLGGALVFMAPVVGANVVFELVLGPLVFAALNWGALVLGAFVGGCSSREQQLSVH